MIHAASHLPLTAVRHGNVALVQSRDQPNA